VQGEVAFGGAERSVGHRVSKAYNRFTF
jgi:hypothetical protein